MVFSIKLVASSVFPIVDELTGNAKDVIEGKTNTTDLSFDKEAVIHDLIKFHMLLTMLEDYYRAGHLQPITAILGVLTFTNHLQ